MPLDGLANRLTILFPYAKYLEDLEDYPSRSLWLAYFCLLEAK